MTGLHSIDRRWDVVVIGAGLGGSVAARRLAEAGAEVLLVDRAPFPRGKVCGCCLGPMALDTLDALGALSQLDTIGLPHVTLSTPVATRSFSTGTMRTVSREQMDDVLVRQAVEAGVVFADACSATINETPHESDQAVTLARKAESVRVAARTIVDAAGLASHRGSTEGRATPYVGLGAMLDDGARLLASPELRMAVSSHGYLGAAPLADGRLTLAAAVKTSAMRAEAGGAAMLAGLLEMLGLPRNVATRTRFRGVPPVRVRQPAQCGAVFRVGDAARFVEPITGEGMGWALAAGDAVTPHVLVRLKDAAAAPTWPAALEQLLRPSQRRCAVVAALVHRPRAFGALLRLLPTHAASGVAAAASGRRTRWGTA